MKRKRKERERNKRQKERDKKQIIFKYSICRDCGFCYTKYSPSFVLSSHQHSFNSGIFQSTEFLPKASDHFCTILSICVTFQFYKLKLLISATIINSLSLLRVVPNFFFWSTIRISYVKMSCAVFMNQLTIWKHLFCMWNMVDC